MANYSYYIESMQALSAALGKALSIAQIKRQIAREYAGMPSSNGDSSAYLDAIFAALPRIDRLKKQQQSLTDEYIEQLKKSVLSVLDYFLSCEDSDLESPAIKGLQKHLQLLNEVIGARYSVGEAKFFIEQERFSLVLQRLAALTDNESVSELKDLIYKISNSINNVGEK